MFLKLIKCPKCESQFTPDFDETITAYMKEDFYIDVPLITLETEPPKIPDYSIFKCVNSECNYTQRYTNEEILKLLNKKLAQIAWTYRQAANKGAYVIDDQATRYLLDEKIGKIITPFKVDTSTIIKEYMKVLKEYEKSKPNKKSNH